MTGNIRHRPYLDSPGGDTWGRLSRKIPGQAVQERTKIGRTPHYKPAPTGTWLSKFPEIARSRGFVHQKGHWAGHLNYYALHEVTGLSRNMLHDLDNGLIPGTQALGRLCDAFKCQPSDLIYREPAPSRTDDLLPGDLPGDTYTLPQHKRPKRR